MTTDLSKYAPHQQRVLAELSELQDKFDKLSLFFNSDKIDQVSPVETVLLQEQLEAMENYIYILTSRIDLWGIE